MSTVPAGWTVADFDPRSPAFAEDPYPFYARLRSEDPVHYIPRIKFWWVTAYPLAAQILQDKRFGNAVPTERISTLPPQYARLAQIPPSMVFRDPPDHTRLRGLVNKAFTPRVVESLRPHIARIAAGLLDTVQRRAEMDLVADFAFHLPAIVIAELLGVPVADRERFKAWSNAIIQSMGVEATEAVRQSGMDANLALLDYFADLLARRRRQRGPGILNQLILAEDDGHRLSEGELLSTCILLLIAGHETTANLLGTGTLLLLQHPVQLALLRRRPDLIHSAVEELLRMTSPAQRFSRFPGEDVEIGGKLIRRGEPVSVVLAAANRDPAVFPDPERLDITRSHNPHLAFGRGIHFCLGAPLARVEAEIGFLALLERLPNLALAGEPVWNRGMVVRGLKELPVRF